MSDSLQPYELQHTRPPCSSPTPGVHLNSGPSSQVMPSSYLTLCHPLFLLPTLPPSIRVFSNESTLHMRWPKYWSFSFSISPSSEHPGLISFRMDWLDFLAVQGTLKIFSSTTVQKHRFFSAQLSSQSNSQHPYMTTGKTIALGRQTFVGNVSAFKYAVWFGHNFSSKE